MQYISVVDLVNINKKFGNLFFCELKAGMSDLLGPKHEKDIENKSDKFFISVHTRNNVIFTNAPSDVLNQTEIIDLLTTDNDGKKEEYTFIHLDHGFYKDDYEFKKSIDGFIEQLLLAELGDKLKSVEFKVSLHPYAFNVARFGDYHFCGHNLRKNGHLGAITGPVYTEVNLHISNYEYFQVKITKEGISLNDFNDKVHDGSYVLTEDKKSIEDSMTKEIVAVVTDALVEKNDSRRHLYPGYGIPSLYIQ